MTPIKIRECGLPAPSVRISTKEFLELTGLSEADLVELIRMDWIVPARTAQQECLFVAADVPRVRRYVRLCMDFELHPVAGSIIVDLLERIDALERQVRFLSRR
jgi:chaperone modulatory protein CbpM